MKMPNTKTRLLSLLGLFVFLWSTAFAQITPLGDAYTNTADPTTNYGAKTLLDVDGASQITYIQFNLASIPSGASVSQATLKLYVSSVTKAGSFNVDYINAAWSEGTIDSSNAPPLGAAIASNVSVTTADKNQQIAARKANTAAPASSNIAATVRVSRPGSSAGTTRPWSRWPRGAGGGNITPSTLLRGRP